MSTMSIAQYHKVWNARRIMCLSDAKMFSQFFYLVQLNAHKSLPIWYNKYITDYNQKKKMRKSEW